MEELGSSSGSSSKQSAARKQTFLLHVLSPSADFPNKVTFPDVPISATVGELKIRICKAVESGPSPELQRLIYRGKPLAQDTALLKDVLTQETVRFYVFRHMIKANKNWIDRSFRIYFSTSRPSPGCLFTTFDIISFFKVCSARNNTAARRVATCSYPKEKL